MENTGKHQEFYFIKMKLWQWMKTEDMGGEPYYDFSEGGRLFFSENNLCPVCASENGAEVFTSTEDNIIKAKDFHCRCCGSCGNVVGSFGEADIKPSETGDDDWFGLPQCVVVMVEK